MSSANKYPAGSLNIAAIRDALYDWCYSVTRGVLSDDGEDIIWRNQSEPLPARPCVTLKLIDGPRPIARDPNLFFGDVGKPFNAGMQQEATLSVQVFASTRIENDAQAQQIAFDLNASLTRQSVLDQLKLAGITIQGLGAPKNLSALEETEYEDRAGFEVALGLAQNIQDNPATIGTINIGRIVDGQELSDQEVNLP